MNVESVIKELNGLKESIKGIERKKVLLINSLHNPHLRLTSSIPVSLEYDGHQFIAYVPDLDIYGCGDSEYEAEEDLRESIVDLYYDLKEETLGQDLKNIRDYLRSIVREE